MPDFPPRRWFIKDDEDRQMVAAMRRPGELPRKIERDVFNICLQSDAMAPCRPQACVIASARAEQTPNLENNQALWQTTLALGRAIRDCLQQLVLEPFKLKEGHKGKPGYSKEWNRLMGLCRWLHRLIRHGDAAMDPAARNAVPPLWPRSPGETKQVAVPEEIMDLWKAAREATAEGGWRGGK